MNARVETSHGWVEGLSLAGKPAWLGIPYAKPPVGGLRFQPPRPPEPWRGVRAATQLPPCAPQRDDAADRELPGAEDCLFLNVTSPGTGGPARPVLVWIHGGGFRAGAGADDLDNGVHLVDHDIVVVSFNYRLGVLGFLYLGEILGEEYAASGNCGVLDQIAVLQWVQDNIGAFGGDPDRVTIVGESSGARSVATLMSLCAGKGLFRQAVSISGGANTVATLEEAAQRAEMLLEYAGISRSSASRVLTCSPDVLLRAEAAVAPGVRSTFLWRPVLDDSVLARPPIDAIADGAAPGIRLLAGSTIAEAVLFDVADPSAAEQSPRVLRAIFGPDGARDVLATYARSGAGEYSRDVLRAIMTDERYTIPTVRLLDAQSAHASAWRYRSDFRPPWLGPVAGGHSGDTRLFWGTGRDDPGDPLGRHPQWRALSDRIRAALAAFVNGEHPGAPGLPQWPRYEPRRRATLLLDLESTIADDPDGDRRAAWGVANWAQSTWWPIPDPTAGSIAER